MTREEVIICKMYLEDLDKHHTCNEYKLLMQLLEQEPCEELDFVQPHKKVSVNLEPCTDAISRLAVLDCFKKWQPYMATRLFDFEKELLALPPVTPAEKVGHWILLDECSNSGYYCSECHKRVVKEGWSDTVKIIKYCPNCGAKIEGEE